MAEASRQITAGTSSDEIRREYGQFRQLLLDRETQILKQIDNERANLEQQQYQNRGDVGDVADASVGDTSADFYMTLADNDRRELLEIQEALARMQRGTYGVCETCEEDIAVERLHKLPYARRCIDCQSALEGRQAVNRPQAVPKL